jgi:hypothetical protein
MEPIQLHQLATDLPHWLQSPQLPTPEDPRSRSAAQSRAIVYPQLFESALERIMGGSPLGTIIANDPRGIQLGRFLYWITKDPDRRRRYEEACMVAAETMAHELPAIADALNVINSDGESTSQTIMEDVQRSALRMKARTYLMEKWSPQRYGDTRRVQIDQTTLSANLTPDDFARMSLADLKRMALERFARAAADAENVEDADVIEHES